MIIAEGGNSTETQEISGFCGMGGGASISSSPEGVSGRNLG